MKKLNFGSGRKVLKGYDNLDIHSRYGANVICDLDVFPYPIKDKSYDEIIIENVMEHLNEPLKVMQELERILKPNGKLIIEVPYGDLTWDSLDHKKEYYITTFLEYRGEDDEKQYGLTFVNAKFKVNQKGLIKFKCWFFNQLIKFHLKIIDYTFLRFFCKALYIRVEYKK